MRVDRARVGAGRGRGNGGEAHGGGKIPPTFTIDEGKVEVQLVGEGGSSMIPLVSDLLGVAQNPRSKDLPLGTTSIRTNDDSISPSGNFRLDVLHHCRLGKEVVNGDVEETLDLRGVEIHGDYVVGTGNGEEVGDKPVCFIGDCTNEDDTDVGIVVI